MSLSRTIKSALHNRLSGLLAPDELTVVSELIDDAERTGKASGMIEAVGALAPYLAEGGATAALRVTNAAMALVAVERGANVAPVEVS